MLYNEVFKSGEKIPYIYEVHEVPPTQHKQGKIPLH